jgi:ATP-dependent Clp protease ATP-binding subunit ClpC
MNWFKELWKALTPRPTEERGINQYWDNATPRAKEAVMLAREEAARLHHDFVGTEHVLLGLIRLRRGVAVNVLLRIGFDLERIRAAVEKEVPAGTEQKASDRIVLTPRMEQVLRIAAAEAKALDHKYIGTEHLFLGLLREEEGVAGRVLRTLGVDVEATRQEILKELAPIDPVDGEPSA